LYDQLVPYQDELRSIFIVSKTQLVKGVIEGAYLSDEVEGVSVAVSAAQGQKCSRCWVHDLSVGKMAGHLEICDRCYGHLESMGMVEK
jgi:isoleucyl-tRNA synthetase